MSNEDLQQFAALLHHELVPVHERLDKIENRLDKMEARLDKVEAEQHRQAVIMENMQDKLQLCYEGISTCNARLDRIEEKIADYDKVKNRLFAVETVVINHSAALIQLDDELTELKKAQ